MTLNSEESRLAIDSFALAGTSDLREGGELEKMGMYHPAVQQPFSMLLPI